MAQIFIETSKEEQERVLATIKMLDGKVTPVTTIADLSGMRPARTRYVLMDLLEQGRVERVPHKAFNKHYVRYSYNVIEK